MFYALIKPFFRNKFQGLFQDAKITPKIAILILLTVCHTFHILYLSLTDFQNFPGPVAFFQDWKVLENATIKFQDFPGFPGPGQTLLFLFMVVYVDVNNNILYVHFNTDLNG